jgi:hypothetical protein
MTATEAASLGKRLAAWSTLATSLEFAKCDVVVALAVDAAP